MGMGALAARWRRCSCISAGPVAQLSPKTSGLSAPRLVERGADLGAEQHGARLFHRHLQLDGHLPALGRHGPPGADDGGLGGQQVEVGLADEQVGPALDEPAGHDLVCVPQLREGDLPERRRLGPRAHRAGDQSAVTVGDLAGDAGRGEADLVGPLGDPVLAEGDGEAAEAGGLHDVGPGAEVCLVHLGDDVGPGDRQDLVAALELRTAEVVGRQPELLDVGAEGAVVDDDALVDEVEEAAHRQVTRLPAGRSPNGSRNRAEAPGAAARLRFEGWGDDP